MVPIKVVLRTTHALRFPLVVLFNIALTVISYGLALALRFDFDPNAAFPPDYIGLPVLILVTARLVTYLRWDLLRGYWRYVSTHDLVRIGKAHLTSSLVFTAAVMFLRTLAIPVPSLSSNSCFRFCSLAALASSCGCSANDSSSTTPAAQLARLAK